MNLLVEGQVTATTLHYDSEHFKFTTATLSEPLRRCCCELYRGRTNCPSVSWVVSGSRTATLTQFSHALLHERICVDLWRAMSGRKSYGRSSLDRGPVMRLLPTSKSPLGGPSRCGCWSKALAIHVRNSGFQCSFVGFIVL